MNYLVTTFDGLGDGVIYYPFFKNVCEKNQKSLFFYTQNIFFSDTGIRTNIVTPSNLKPIDEYFRKFNKGHWHEILTFIKQNNINKIINLRTIGRRFEQDYYNFKKWFLDSNTGVDFYDDESLTDKEKFNTNIRNIVAVIFKKAVSKDVSNETDDLKSYFPLTNGRSDIAINMHSRGVFKLWESQKWIELILAITSLNKKIKIYEGFSDQEKTYTNKIINELPFQTRKNIEIIKQKSPYEMGKSLQSIFLLISVDSGLIHFADAIGINTLGIYLTTSPIVWGGVTSKFHSIYSKHMLNCKNFYRNFGMCINNKQKCEEISNGNDDISIPEVLKEINKIYEEEN